MGIYRNRVRFAAILSLCIFCLTCSKNNPTGPSNDAGDEMKTGAARTYQVSADAATSVMDSISGTTFVFPNGGSGTLTVAPVISGPDVGVAAARMTVQYSGSGEVAISVPHTEGNEEIVYIYRKIPNVSVEGANSGDMAWQGVLPSEKRNDATIFTLPSASAQKRAGKRALSGDELDTVAIATLKSNSEEMNRRTECTRKIWEAVDFWLNNLPPDLAEAARKKIEGDTRYSITWSSEGSCYDHTTATFFIQVDGAVDSRANIHTFAHEAGHYMTHILAGYDRYVDMLNRMPSNWYGAILAHGFADYFESRMYVVEEYAYLSDFLITGTVDASDLAKPQISTMFGSNGPEVKDFPTFEGFGAIMLGSLLRTTPNVNSYWWKKSGISRAPVVSAPSGDILALTARGARDTNELRGVIQDYLDSRGNDHRFKLAAMLEPLGWSYHGSGTIVDTSGKAIPNAVVTSVSQDGAGEYSTPASGPSGTDGKFTLQRIFPGANILRVFTNSGKDSTDIPFSADWSKLTNTALDLGKITVGDMLSTRRLTVTQVSDIKYGDDTVIARITVTATADVTGYGLRPDSIQTERGMDINAGLPATVKITASCAIEVVNGSIGSYDYTIVNTFGKSRFRFEKVSYGATMLQFSTSDNTYTAEFTLPEAGSILNINVLSFVENKMEIYEKGALTESSEGERYSPGPSFYFYGK